MRRTGICGAVETILVHQDIANSFVPLLVDSLAELDCEIRCCDKTMGLDDRVMLATEED